MTLWPFSNRRGATRLDPAAAPSQAQQQPSEKPSQSAHDITTTSSTTKQSRRSGQLRKTLHSATQPASSSPSSPFPQDSNVREKTTSGLATPPLEPVTTASPMDLDVRPSTAGSAGAEDITALPGSRALRTSPHLRPVTQDTADIPYNWNLRSAGSQHSLPNRTGSGAQQRRAKLQRTSSRNKRAAHDSPLARRRSSKKRKDEHLREEEIRAMSAPIDVPRRNQHGDSGILRRESKKSRGPLNRNFERPVSVVSLPFEDSIHSSMSGEGEQRNYRLSVLDVISPRPAIRMKERSRQPGNEAGTSSLLRKNSKREAISRQTLHEHKPSKETMKERERVDSLADDLDSAQLRDILDRDRKRRERKRDRDAERLKRKLERKAEKQRTKEWLDRQQQKSKDKAEPTGESEKEVGKAPAAEDDDTEMAEAPAFAMDEEQADKQVAATSAADPFRDPEGQPINIMDIHPALRPRPPEVIPKMPLSSAGEDDGLHTEANPFADGPTPLETPAVESAQPVVFTRPQAPITSPVTSTVYHGDRAKASKILGTDVAGNEFTVSNTALQASVRPQQVFVKVPTRDLSSPTDGTSPTPLSASASKKKPGFLASLFRSKRNSVSESPKDMPQQESSFVNTSREEMSRSLPAHLVEPPPSSAHSRKSGPPLRTTSIFREHLPESPLSPPDSRMQSPVDRRTSGSTGIPRSVVQKMPSITNTNPNTAGSSRVGSPTFAGTESPFQVSAAASKLMSQSLASVDSEASWLSGRPHRATSAARKHGSLGGAGGDLGRQEEFAASYEELGIPEDEYFKRLNTPRGAETRASGLSVAMAASRKASSSALCSAGPTSDVGDGDKPREHEEQMHAGASRVPKVVHNDPRHKSSEGLLNMYTSSVPITSDDDADKTPEAEYPTPAETPTESRNSSDAEEMSPVQRATSVNLGKGHARNISAGSAKLLDIRRGSVTSLDPSTPSRSQFNLAEGKRGSMGGKVVPEESD